MGQFASNALNGFFDAIAAGKDLGTVFKNLATDLAKMAVQILIIKPLLDSLKSSFGSGGGLGGFGGRSFGGPPPAPPIPGAAPFVPFSPLGQYGSPQALLSGGRSGAVPTTGGAKVNVVINNNSRAQVEAAETTGQDGSKQIEVTIRDVVRSQILEGGFDRQFRGAFGMVRQGV